VKVKDKKRSENHAHPFTDGSAGERRGAIKIPESKRRKLCFLSSKVLPKVKKLLGGEK